MAKKALLVGINDYQGISDLRGCINDVTNMRDILKTYLRFTNRDIRVLVDNRATKANIIARLEYMVRKAKTGDFLVFHFSGHGSQIRDRDGDELKDHMDELICPYDMNWDGTFITDDTLNSIFTKLPKGVLLEVFLDSCHSGTGLRDVGLGRPPELAPEHPTLSRYLPPPIDIACRLEGDEDDLKTERSFSGTDRSTVHHILWSGCKDNQTSADAYINNSYNGAFTYYFCKHMRTSGGGISRKELLRRVRQSLYKGGYSQIPQLECEATVRAGRTLSAKKTTKKDQA
ncbi:caspase family protein [Desulfogranum marinum]|uniref:caspase family protein n=1 Tax=Desulfogranum marinum TaxID=453220 RepID=UPI0019633A1F|nr:caspase family protein [Desulfogranum marinum]MBM9512283.1 caspase family protein [Desulfogranum marinum]